jgi:hypothetical protein
MAQRDMGSTPISAPWDDLSQYRAPLLKRALPRHAEPLWRWRRGYLMRRLPRIRLLCSQADHVAWEWVGAILWDELARRDITERLTDWTLGKLGRDPSVGPYQVTGRTGLDVVAFVPRGVRWADAMRSATEADMRRKLMRFDFATHVVIGRCAQILATWRDRGFDPGVPGGLGPHRVSPIGLIGTLYSQGLGLPKPDPRPNGRGRQIERFAAQLRGLSCT